MLEAYQEQMLLHQGPVVDRVVGHHYCRLVEPRPETGLEVEVANIRSRRSLGSLCHGLRRWSWLVGELPFVRHVEVIVVTVVLLSSC